VADLFSPSSEVLPKSPNDIDPDILFFVGEFPLEGMGRSRSPGPSPVRSFFLVKRFGRPLGVYLFFKTEPYLAPASVERILVLAERLMSLPTVLSSSGDPVRRPRLGWYGRQAPFL